MHRLGHFQSKIKRGTSNLPVLQDETLKSNYVSVDMHDIPASHFSDGGYFKFMTTKQ